MRELRTDAIVGIVLCLPLCYVWGVLLIVVSGGWWVGASHKPLPPLVVAGTYVPGFVYLVYGVVLALMGFSAKYPFVGWVGVACAVVGVALFGVMWFAIAMWHIA